MLKYESESKIDKEDTLIVSLLEFCGTIDRVIHSPMSKYVSCLPEHTWLKQVEVEMKSRASHFSCRISTDRRSRKTKQT
jgi:hypothetical protein